MQNYKEAGDKELAELTKLEKEMQNAINGTGNGGTTKPNPQPVKLNTLDATHYGDYVDYPVNIGRGPAGIAETHKSDWRIFYNDGTYVYLIASYYLLNSQAPAGIGMSGYEGKPYTTYWKTEPTTFTPITEEVRTNYKMSWNKNETNPNIKAVSTLLDTTKWTKFVNRAYAEDAIGAPTLEMWVDSWNSVENTKLYCNNSNEKGYYIGTVTNPTTVYIDVSNSNNLYFPVKKNSDSTGDSYWLASMSASDINTLLYGHVLGSVTLGSYNEISMSLRPIVRLKADVMAKQENGVWKLQ